MMNFTTYAILLCYMVAAVSGHIVFWHKRATWLKPMLLALWSGLGLQLLMLAVDVWRYGHVWGSASFNFVFMLVGIWTAAALFIHVRTRNSLMALFAGPIALLCLAAVSLFPKQPTYEQVQTLQGVWLNLHIHLTLAAYALLGLGFIHTVAYLGLAYMLQHKKLLAQRSGLSLESLNLWVNRLTWAGLAVLSFGLFAGWVWAVQEWAGPWVSDIKVLGAVVAWLAYVMVLSMRLRGRLHGKQGMWCLVACFVLLMAGLLLNRFIPNAYHV